MAPDGQWVGFFDGDAMRSKRSRSPAGRRVTLTAMDGTAPRGATWGADDTIVYATPTRPPGCSVSRPPAATDGPHEARPCARRSRSLWPEFLPGGQRRCSSRSRRRTGLDNAQIAVLDLRTARDGAIRGGSHAHYVPTGHLVYGAAGTLRAVAFDLGRLGHGPPVPVSIRW